MYIFLNVKQNNKNNKLKKKHGTFVQIRNTNVKLILQTIKFVQDFWI